MEILKRVITKLSFYECLQKDVFVNAFFTNDCRCFKIREIHVIYIIC